MSDLRIKSVTTAIMWEYKDVPPSKLRCALCLVDCSEPSEGPTQGVGKVRVDRSCGAVVHESCLEKYGQAQAESSPQQPSGIQWQWKDVNGSAWQNFDADAGRVEQARQMEAAFKSGVSTVETTYNGNKYRHSFVGNPWKTQPVGHSGNTFDLRRVDFGTPVRGGITCPQCHQKNAHFEEAMDLFATKPTQPTQPVSK
jgi:hypothetical protein